MKKIEHLVTEKRISIAMVIGLLMSLLPIIVLAFYNYPCADDFSASDTAYWVWNSTDSMLEVLEAAWENVVYNYHKWSGVYASVFWTSLQPGLFGEQFYGITTVISVGLFTIAGAYLTYVISKKYIGGSGYSWISICALYLFVSIQCMPNGNEGLYWHAGGANYTWAFAFLLLVLTCVLSIYKEEKTQKKMVQLVLASLCAVLVGGGNYITALQGCIWLVFLDVIFVVVDKKRNVDTYAKALKKNVWVMIPTLILIVAFLISVIAPGNKVRMGMSSGISAIDAILASFQYALILPLEEWLGWQVWILLAVSIPFMWNIVKKQEFSFSYPMVVVLLGYCFIAAGFTPSLYAQGAFQAGRLHDTVYFITIIILHAVSFYLTGWIYHRKRRSF